MSKRSSGPKVPGVSVYPRGKKWAYIIYGEPDLLTCKRERVYEGRFESEEAARTAAIKARNELDSGRYVKPSQRTVEQFLNEWLRTIEHSVKPTSYANCRDNVKSYIVPVIGGRRLQAISVPVLNAFYRHLLDSGRGNHDTNSAMYEYWKARSTARDGLGPQPWSVEELAA